MAWNPLTIKQRVKIVLLGALFNALDNTSFERCKIFSATLVNKFYGVSKSGATKLPLESYSAILWWSSEQNQICFLRNSMTFS